MHYFDSPSLSIIVPIIEMGLKSRDTDTKRLACQLMGSVTNLIKSFDDLKPYITRLVYVTKLSLFDNIPEIRNISA